MAFLRKFRNRLLAFKHLVFSKKIQNWSAQCHFWENLEIDYLVWTMLFLKKKLRTEVCNAIFEEIFKDTTWSQPSSIFRENWELMCPTSFLRKFRNRLLGLNHLVFPKKIESWSAQCHFWENLEINYLLWTMLYFQRKFRTKASNVISEEIKKSTTCFETRCIFKEDWELKCEMSFLRKVRNRLLPLKNVLFWNKVVNWTPQCHFWENLEIYCFLWNILYFQRKLRTELRNVIFEEI